MKIISIFLILIAFQFAEASMWVAGSYGMRFENDSEKEQMSSRLPVGILMGKRWNVSEVTLEFHTFSAKTGNTTFEITRKSELLVSEYRYYPFNIQNFSWYPYFTTGAGVYREKITTRFLKQTDSRNSKIYPTIAIGTGTWGNISKSIKLGAEFRVLVAEAFNPTGLLDLGIRLGYSF